MVISTTMILRIDNSFPKRLLWSGFNNNNNNLIKSLNLHCQHRHLIHYNHQNGHRTLSSVDSRKNYYDKLDTTFTNTEQAYRSKTTFELIRAIAVLYVSSFDTLVYNHDKVWNFWVVFLKNLIIFAFFNYQAIKMVPTFNG